MNKKTDEMLGKVVVHEFPCSHISLAIVADEDLTKR